VTETELEKAINAKRLEFGIVPRFETKKVVDVVEKTASVVPRVAPVCKPVDQRFGFWSRLVSDRGRRYENCRLSNFETKTDSQKDAIAKLGEFAVTIKDSVAQGRGVILFGSKGTGKDHLMMGLAWAAIDQFVNVVWINGADMRGDVRDSTKGEEMERDYVARLLRPQVLWMSDPLPVSGALTDAQQDRLFRVLDARYSQMKPTWVTVNVSNRVELEQRLGAQNADRLRDGSLAVFCDWPSYREAV
jgi:DNA replication protein DnaC